MHVVFLIVLILMLIGAFQTFVVDERKRHGAVFTSDGAKIIGSLVGFILIFIGLGVAMNYDMGGYYFAVVFGLVVWKIIASLVRRRDRSTGASSDVNSARDANEAARFLTRDEEGKAEVVRLIDRHGRALVAKYNQLIYKDDYGNVIFDKWFDERDYFIQNVIYREFGTSPFGLSEEALQTIVDERVLDLVYDPSVDKVQDVEALSPLEFEQYCASLLTRQGWQTTLTKASGDQGVDILADKDGRRVAIQCKKYSAPVGNGAVQEVIAGKAFYNADLGVVVTNATYTPHAKQLANTTQIRLLHHSQLADFDSVLAS